MSKDYRFSTWVLLERGLKTIKAGYRLKDPVPVCAVREQVDISERSVLELMLSLDMDGWTHMVKEKGKDEPYVPGSTAKVWFTKPGDIVVNHNYLLLLLQNEKETPHWHSASHYLALLEGRQIGQRSSRKKVSAIKHVQEDEWDIPAVCDAAPKQKRRTMALRRSQAATSALEDGENDVVANDDVDVDSAAVEDEVLRQLEMMSDTSDCSENLDAQQAEVPVEGGSSASSTSSSTSSSSSSSSDSSDSDDDREPARGSGEKAEPASASSKANAKAKAKQSSKRKAPAMREERAVNPTADNFRYGMGYAVRVFKAGQAIGWEMSCNHPSHVGAKCRKNLKSETKQRTEAQTIQLLKIWLIRGRHCTDAKEHMQDIWSEVERDFKQGQLEAAPEDPPLNYTSRDGQRCFYASK